MTKRVIGRSGALCSDPAEQGYRCFLCGGSRFARLHHWPVGDRWNLADIAISVWRCECDLVFLHPVPLPEQLPGGGDWWSEKRKKRRRNLLWKNIRSKLSYLCVGSPRHRLVKYTRKAVGSGRLLDVGCGDGRLLELAGPYYDCVGLEPSPIGAERTRGKGFSVIQNTFDDARIEPRSFDLVVMDSVIEHVGDPLAAVKKANRILEPGGVIALKTNKFGGPAYRMHGRGWNGFRHGYHTFLFTGATLQRTLELGGFEVLAHPRRDRMLDDILILWGRKLREVQREDELVEPSVSSSNTSNRPLAQCG